MTAGAPRPAELLFRDGRKRLADAGLPSPDLDANILLEHAADISVLTRMTEPGRLVPVEKSAAFAACIERRIGHEPVHRIIGWREFYGLPLRLNDATLVPRPDTETLVDLVLPFVSEMVAQTGACSILDIGTGSGAIALALLATVPGTIATGTDISDDALAMASENARTHGLDKRFTAVRSNWFDHVSGRFDLVVSNPPYIRSQEIQTLEPDVRDFDPVAALDGGVNGLDAYGVIAETVSGRIATGGCVAVEIGHDQREAVTVIFEKSGFTPAETRKDYAGRDRAIFFVK